MSVHKFCLCAAGAMTIATMGITASPAEAQEGLTVVGKRSDVPTARVRYGDIDLSSHGGERRLWSRIALAIDTLCPAFGRPSLDDAVLIRECRTVAKTGAEPQVAAAIDRSRSGATLASAAAIVITTGR